MARIEVYSKDWCPYCTKAKALLKSKGLNYEEIDITADLARSEEMIERSGRHTVPQIFINGESIGGYDDLANLNATGELDRRLGLLQQQEYNKVYDVAIIGAGPAGMSAAVYAIRKNLSTLIISTDIGGQVGTTNEVENYPGFPRITGPELVENFTKHMDKYDIEQLVGHKVTGIEIQQRCKILKTTRGKEIKARAVIIATGANKRKLNIPGEETFAGKGVVYCSTCDGQFFKGLTVAVIGGGNSGLEAAIEMSVISPKVYLISRTELKGDEILKDKVATTENIELLCHHEPVEIHGAEKVHGLAVRDCNTGEVRELAVEGVFVEVGLYPNTDFVIDLLETNELGEIKVNNQGHTGVRGIFAAGDVTEESKKQIVIAAGSGATAALGAFEYLISQV